MDIKGIETELEYQRALVELDLYMVAEIDTPEGQRLLLLAALIEDYEAKMCGIDSAV